MRYKEIAEEIKEHIEEAGLVQGDKLPSLEELMKQYNTSRSTIRAALDLLEKRGFVYQRRGSGVFVRKLDRQDYIDLGFSRGFKKNIDESAMRTEVLEVTTIPADDEVARNLKIEKYSPIYYIKRLRYIDGNPLCLEESFYDKEVVSYINKEIASHSIFYYMREGLKLDLGFADSYFQIDKINKYEAKLLNLAEGEPKLYLENVFFLANGKAFNFSKTTYHYKYSKFFIQAGTE